MNKNDYSMEGIRKAIRELVESQKKTDEEQRKTDKMIKELRNSQKKTDEQQKKTDEQQKKTDEQQKKTDEIIKELHKETQEELKKTLKSVARLTDGWGMFVESLVAPSIPKIFNDLGFSVAGYGTRQKRHLNGGTMEIDVLAVANTKRKVGVVIAISVKSRLSMSDVRNHIKDLRRLFDFFPEYNGSELLGVIAGIRLDEGVVSYGEKNGLYVIGSSGDAVELLNKKGFKPRIWERKR